MILTWNQALYGEFITVAPYATICHALPFRDWLGKTLSIDTFLLPLYIFIEYKKFNKPNPIITHTNRPKPFKAHTDMPKTRKFTEKSRKFHHLSFLLKINFVNDSIFLLNFQLYRIL